MISAQLVWGSLLFRVHHKNAENSHSKNFESALYLTSVRMPLRIIETGLLFLLFIKPAEYKLLCKSYETTTGRNSSVSRVTWEAPELDRFLEGATISQVSNIYHQDYPFPIGLTRIEYVARDVNGKEEANCTVNITVHGELVYLVL